MLKGNYNLHSVHFNDLIKITFFLISLIKNVLEGIMRISTHINFMMLYSRRRQKLLLTKQPRDINHVNPLDKSPLNICDALIS